MAALSAVARVHADPGGWWAEVPDLPGCLASGATLDELADALDDAVRLWLAPPTQGGAMTTPEDGITLDPDDIARFTAGADERRNLPRTPDDPETIRALLAAARTSCQHRQKARPENL